MFGLNYKLENLEKAGTPIMAGVVGAGNQGTGMINQMVHMPGMKPAIISDIRVDVAAKAYEHAGLSKDQVVVSDDIDEINEALKDGKYVVTSNFSNVTKAELIETIVDATGVPEVGAHLAVESIENGKNIVMLNVETDITIGAYLKKIADEKGVVYTGSAGDEPGAVKEYYDFAKAMGFNVRVIGKGQNHMIDRTSNPETVAELAKELNLAPKMLASFKDGTKTMVEMTAMANSTGLTCDVRGSHGPTTDVNGLAGTFLTKGEGGVLDNYGVVEYVNGVAPGVFAIIAHDNEEVQAEMKYLRMGDGPNYTLFRPFHLCSLETPLSVAMASIDKMATIAPIGKPVCEVITVAKKDLKAGESLDYIGGFTVYGMIEKYDVAKENNYVPLGLINKNTKVKVDIKMGQEITYDMLEMDESSYVYELRKLQDQLY